MTETYEDLNALNLDQLRQRVLELQNRLLQRSMGEAFYADVCRMEDEVKQLRAQLARAKGGTMNRGEKEALRNLGKLIGRVVFGSLTTRIRRDPAGYARHVAKLEMRYQAKSQRLGELRRERRRLMHEVQQLKNERDLLAARLSMREPKPKPAQPEQQPPADSAHAAAGAERALRAVA